MSVERAGRDALIAYAVVAALVAILVRIDVTLPAVGHLGSALVAVVFLYAPVIIAWRRTEDLIDHGFRSDPLGRNLLFAAVAILAILPPFTAAYIGFYDLVCDTAWLRKLAPPGTCGGWDGMDVKLPDLGLGFLEFSAVQLIVVALPEELFFRGTLHRLLEQRFPPTRRWLGGGIGLALVLSSAAFALVHLPKNGDPRALATFFPGLLFGWMRSATGSILPSTLVHAASNIWVRALDLTFLR